MTTDTETKNREQELHDRRVAYMRESLERLCSTPCAHCGATPTEQAYIGHHSVTTPGPWYLDRMAKYVGTNAEFRLWWINHYLTSLTPLCEACLTEEGKLKYAVRLQAAEEAAEQVRKRKAASAAFVRPPEPTRYYVDGRFQRPIKPSVEERALTYGRVTDDSNRAIGWAWERVHKLCDFAGDGTPCKACGALLPSVSDGVTMIKRPPKSCRSYLETFMVPVERKAKKAKLEIR